MSRCLRRADREGRTRDDDPVSLRAWALHLRRSVEARRALDQAGIPRVRGPRDEAEQEEMLLLAEREEWRATRLQRASRAEGRSTRDVARMSQQQYEAILAEYAVEPLVTPTSSRIDHVIAAIEVQQVRRDVIRQ